MFKTFLSHDVQSGHHVTDGLTFKVGQSRAGGCIRPEALEGREGLCGGVAEFRFLAETLSGALIWSKLGK